MTQSRHELSNFTPSTVVLFFLLAFFITWSIIIPALAYAPKDLLTLFFIPAAFCPFFAAIIVIGKSKGKSGIRNWLRSIFSFRIPLMLYLSGAFFLPLLVGGLHFCLYRILGGQPDFSSATPWYFYLAYLIPTALLTGGNEEPGWRGFALPALLKWFHPSVATLILGFIHGAWHLPLMKYYDTTFILYSFNIIGLTFIFNWFYLKSRYWVIPVMLFHAGTNVIGSFIPTPADLLSGLGTFMFLRGVVYWGLAIIIIVITKGKLGYNSGEQASNGY